MRVSKQPAWRLGWRSPTLAASPLPRARARHRGEHSGNDRGRRGRAARRDDRREGHAIRFRVRNRDGVDGTFTLPGLRPGTYEITVTMNQYKPQAQNRPGARSARSLTVELQSHDRRRSTPSRCRSSATRRLIETGPPRSRRGHDRAGAVSCRRTSATSSTSRPRPRREACLDRRDAARGDGRRTRRDAGQRLHRRRQLQERRPRRRRRRPGLEPRLAVSADRGAGVPGAHAELQGGAREGVERGDHAR